MSSAGLGPEARLARGAEALGVSLDATSGSRCLAFLEQLLDANRNFNLTAIRDPGEAIVKHFLDSLTVVPLLPPEPGARILDVGTGAGFPGIVLKIARPDLHVVLLDSVGKRLKFLDAAIDALGLEGVETLQMRAEDAGREPRCRERFDAVTARAVAELRVLAEWCLPLVSIGGRFIAMKGPRGAEELRVATAALRQLGGGAIETVAMALPMSGEERLLIAVDKERPTPKTYPRRAADTLKRPL